MCKSLDLFMLISCFALTAESQTGQILPPQNVSLRWISDFCPDLSWAPATGCKYTVQNSGSSDLVDKPHWRRYTIMNGGFVKYSLNTVCNGSKSEAVHINSSYPELVKDLGCYLYSAEEAYCSWSTHSPDLRFYYELVDESLGSTDDDSCSSKTQECSLYSSINGVMTGCRLRANISHTVHILFNGTVNNTYSRNTFKKQLKDDVRPAALSCSVKASKNTLKISWSDPGIKCSSDWRFKIKYTKCNISENLEVGGGTSYQLVRTPHCPYRISVKATCEKQETPWSQEIYLEAEAEDPNAFVYAAVLIPLLVACLAGLTYGFFWKFKKVIFPKVPEPPLGLFEGILDNNNESIIGKMCVTTEEEESCKITLVADPEVSKQDRS